MIFDDHDDDRHAARRRWNAYLSAVDAELAEEARSQYRCETNLGKVLDADIVIKPGSQHANAAAKVGREDEYSNRMKQRYGGEW